jgi:hypothetical protein
MNEQYLSMETDPNKIDFSAFTDPEVNYCEIVLFRDELIPNILFNIDHTDDFLKKKIGCFIRYSKNGHEIFGGVKYFKKKYRKYVVDNKEYYKHANGSIMVNERNLLDMKVQHVQRSYIASYKKKNLAVYMFPWSMNIHNMVDVERTSFLFRNNVYLNFERSENTDDKTMSYYVYINCNINKNSNIENLTKLVNAITQELM